MELGRLLLSPRLVKIRAHEYRLPSEEEVPDLPEHAALVSELQAETAALLGVHLAGADFVETENHRLVNCAEAQTAVSSLAKMLMNVFGVLAPADTHRLVLYFAAH
jgi:hypothetical protein